MPSPPRTFIVTSERSGVGKTSITLGLALSFQSSGYDVSIFKCGPDYLDASYHRRIENANKQRYLALSQQRQTLEKASKNLDPWAMSADYVYNTIRATRADIVIIEGVMGLFDGAIGGRGSTADLAKMIGCPVVLILDATSRAQSIEVSYMGLSHLCREHGIGIAGWIVNNIASERHWLLLQEGLQRIPCNVSRIMRDNTRTSSLASNPTKTTKVNEDNLKLDDKPKHFKREAPNLPFSSPPSSSPLPSRWLGLLPAFEHSEQSWSAIVGHLSNLMKYVDTHDLIGRVEPLPDAKSSHHTGQNHGVTGQKYGVSSSLSPVISSHTHNNLAKINNLGRKNTPTPDTLDTADNANTSKVLQKIQRKSMCIAVAYDTAFSFVYAHTLAQWQTRGARIIFYSPINGDTLPHDCDIVYLPGGYVEIHAHALSVQTKWSSDLQAHVAEGGGIYGECAGFMAMGRTLTTHTGQSYAMANLLPIDFTMVSARRSLGYVTAIHNECECTTLGELYHHTIRGHYHHYGRISHIAHTAKTLDTEPSAEIKTQYCQITHLTTEQSVVSSDIIKPHCDSHIKDTPQFSNDCINDDYDVLGMRQGRVTGSFLHVICNEDDEISLRHP